MRMREGEAHFFRKGIKKVVCLLYRRIKFNSRNQVKLMHVFCIHRQLTGREFSLDLKVLC